MNPTKAYYEKLADTTIKNLEMRQIEAHYCPTSQDAVNLALSMVNSDSTVAFGGSMTLSESGLMKALSESGDITLLDRSKAKSPEEVTQIYHDALSADYFFMSSNAISVSGELVNIDGTGNRLAALVYGPSHVIILAGMNKVVPTVQAALMRVKNTAYPINAARLNRKTPCTISGICSDCQSPDCICAQTVITRRSNQAGRIKVILIGEELGY